MNQPTTDDRPATTPGTTTSPTASPKRPRPRWVAPVGVAAAACAAGIGVLVYDANNQPPPQPIDVATEYGTSQRLIDESIDDALQRTGTPPTEYGTSQRLIDESIDDALAERNPAATSGTGQLLQPGQPDGGVAQPATSAAFVTPSVDQIIADLEANSESQLSTAPPADGSDSIRRPGQPDGYWQATENASSTAPVANHGCKISGPC